tara:strand:- start:1534 stop:2364 length:831 start_codon:yes stop_codon:yes gene_type:complete
MGEENNLTEILKWHMENGIDEALQEKPHNRLIPSESKEIGSKNITNLTSAKTKSFLDTPTKTKRSSTLISREETISSAFATAKSANSLKALKKAVAEFDGCPIKKTAKNLVFGEGPDKAPLMFIGEAPGAHEDREGRPFIGPAGQLLDHLLSSISFERNDVYITNILPWRPPGNRTPTPAEIIACLPFIQRQIELVSPKILVLVGGVATKALLGSNQGIMRMRGKWLEYNGEKEGIKTLITTRAILHPAYLLRSPAQKRETWIDLLEIKQKLNDMI